MDHNISTEPVSNEEFEEISQGNMKKQDDDTDSVIQLTLDKSNDFIDSEISNSSNTCEKIEKDITSEKDVNAIPKTKRLNYVWVSNINNQISAAMLREHFLQMGKVLSVKILASGSQYFGYVTTESRKTANKFIRYLNNSFVDGKKISVTRSRPAIHAGKMPLKSDAKYNVRRQSDTSKISFKNAQCGRNISQSKENKYVELRNINFDIDVLKNDLKESQKEASSYRTKLRELNHNYDSLRKKYDELKADFRIIRSERNKLLREKEEYEKKRKSEEFHVRRYKSHVKRELENVKDKRRMLDKKLDEIDKISKSFKNQTGRIRSPTSPLASGVGQRELQTQSHSIPVRSKTPPPPPPPLFNYPERQQSNYFPSDPLSRNLTVYNGPNVRYDMYPQHPASRPHYYNRY